ncbi:MAG TPA: c-type cytochrome [Pyrinomonadaceae bacterium]|nr:c-type cytochrome [Pyrinomonadaceae bacterium]
MNQRKGFATSFIFFLVSLFLIESAFALTLKGARSDVTETQRSKRNSTDVVDIFRANCARCHGAEGRGDTPLGQTYQAPNFTDDQWWRTNSKITGTKSLVSIVSNGKGGMPAFGKKLKPSEIKLLVNYVRRFRPSN